MSCNTETRSPGTPSSRTMTSNPFLFYFISDACERLGEKRMKNQQRGTKHGAPSVHRNQV